MRQLTATDTATASTEQSDDSDSGLAEPHSAEVRDLLSDRLAREVLRTISTDQLPAREIAERTDLSRATVYRRLNRLEGAGLVESSMTYHPDGHHRRVYAASFDPIRITIHQDITIENET